VPVAFTLGQVCLSQNAMVPSSPPLTSVEPSDENARFGSRFLAAAG